MEARSLRTALVAVVLLVSMGAKHRTANFVVETADPKLAVQLAEASERYRHDLAVAWLGKALPNWSQPCPMTVQVGPHLGAGGSTTFVFDRGEVFGWRMSIQGSAERLLDSVLPHEITHMVFASHFRQPVPRWADEGGATSVEHQSERDKHRRMLYQFLQTGRGIAFNKMFAMKDYPRDIMPLYAQGHSVADYLIQIGGRRKYVDFIGDGLRTNNWPSAVKKHYGIADLGAMQTTWLAWVREGSPPLKSRPDHPAPAGPVEFAATGAPAPSVYAGHDRPKLGEPRQVAVAPIRPAEVRPGQMIPVELPAVSAPSRAAPAMYFESPGKAMATANGQPSPYQVLPESGWHAAGEVPRGPSSAQPSHVAASSGPMVPGAAGAVSTEVTRPQPFERPRQVILEWSRP